MKPPSPLRRLVPPLVWPAGLLLLLGYWSLGRTPPPADVEAARVEASRLEAERVRREVRTGAIVGARAPGGEVVSVAPQVRSVSVALEAPRQISLVIPLIVVVGIGLWAVVLRRSSADGSRSRAPGAGPDPEA